MVKHTSLVSFDHWIYLLASPPKTVSHLKIARRSFGPTPVNDDPVGVKRRNTARDFERFVNHSGERSTVINDATAFIRVSSRLALPAHPLRSSENRPRVEVRGRLRTVTDFQYRWNPLLSLESDF